VTSEIINQLKDELLQVWTHFMIPEYHKQVFYESIYSLQPPQYSPIMAKEIEEIQKEQAPI
jgi:hypothetical protein